MRQRLGDQLRVARLHLGASFSNLLIAGYPRILAEIRAHELNVAKNEGDQIRQPGAGQPKLIDVLELVPKEDQSANRRRNDEDTNDELFKVSTSGVGLAQYSYLLRLGVIASPPTSVIAGRGAARFLS